MESVPGYSWQVSSQDTGLVDQHDFFMFMCSLLFICILMIGHTFEIPLLQLI